MRNSNFRAHYFLFAVTAACASSPTTPTGGDDDAPAGQTGVAPIDPGFPGDGSDVTPVAECDYTEKDDATNDYLASSGYQLEQTGFTFGGTQRTICGQVNTGHYDSYYSSVDIDNYGLTLQNDGDVVVTLTGALADVETVGVYAYNSDLGSSSGNYFVYDHGVFAAHLPAGNYEFSVEAYDEGDLAAPISYKVKINTDHPYTRCARVVHAPDYTESFDGADSTGNDMVDVNYANYPAATRTNGADAAEVSGMMMSKPAKFRMWGESGVHSVTDSYFDRDTYSVTTGPDTNQISLRLNWSEQHADLDFYLFQAGTSVSIGSATTEKLGEEEYGVFSVQPNTSYWVWVGAAGGTDPSYLPAEYNVSLCPDEFDATF